MQRAPDPEQLRTRLGAARVCLLFSPELCGARSALEILGQVLPWIDMVQVRPKALGGARLAPCDARSSFEWCQRVLELVHSRADLDVLVLVDDRVDVARALWMHGCAGVHVGTHDCPPSIARSELGPGALIGLSTHDTEQVVAALDEPVDYLGFGPVHATGTKGYSRGLGAEAAWIAHEASPLPLFPIGGIGLENAGELARIGRAAVGASLLSAADPAQSARALRAAITQREE